MIQPIQPTKKGAIVMKKNLWKRATSTIPGPVDLEPITVPADVSIPDEAFNAEPVPVFECEHIINDALTWLLPFMFSDDIILEPEYKHDCVISLTCRVDDESTETINFYSDDRPSEC